MKIISHHDVTFFEQLRPEWNDLVRRSQANSVFSLWEWHYHWWNAYQPGVIQALSFRDAEGRLVAIAPLYVESHAEYGRVLRIIGSDDVTDYLDIIIDKQHIEAVLKAFATYLAEHSADFDLLELCNLPQNSPSYTDLVRFLAECQFDVVTRQQEVCPIIDLPETFEAYLNQIDSKQARELRRKLRIAEGQMGSVQWYIVNQTHDIQQEAQKFLKLMEQSHPEKAQFLENAQHVAFFSTMLPAMMELGVLQLNFLTVNEEAVASYLNFDYEGQIWVYNSGLAPHKYANLSPGIVLLCYNIRHAIEQGRTHFDFLRGDEQYKYRMGAQDSAIYNVRARMMSH